MTRDEIVVQFPIDRIAREYGLELKKNAHGYVCLCPFHKEKTASCTINPEGNLFYCFGCHRGGSVIDFVAEFEHVTVGEAMRKLGGDPEPVQPFRFAPGAIATPSPLSYSAPPRERVLEAITECKEVASYSYRDPLGAEIFQVVRYEPKTFKQRHLANGEWIWSMEGVNRVLYNLPQVLKASASNIWVVEGEKDCDNLKKLGIVATCNVGGAGRWMEGYSATLKGKDVVLCGDNDEPGKDHIAKVLAAIAPVAKSVRVIQIPPPHKDVSDLIATFEGELEAASHALLEMVEDAPVLTGGIEIPVQTMAELEHAYIREALQSNDVTFDCGSWLPALGNKVRPLVPGEVILVLAATGVGKTAALQNLAKAAAPLPVLLFELELPGTLTFERFASIATGIPAIEVLERYKAGQLVPWKATGALDHIVVCSRPGLSPEAIERIILLTELKTGVRPKVVAIDYHQLLAGEGKSRYEKASYSAERIKIVAKNTRTIIIVSSQVTRKEDDSLEVKLSDGKDSGSLENSAGLVLGFWRDARKPGIMHIKILKNTKGPSGGKVECDFDGKTLLMTPRAAIDDEDIPKSNGHKELEEPLLANLPYVDA